MSPYEPLWSYGLSFGTWRAEGRRWWRRQNFRQHLPTGRGRAAAENCMYTEEWGRKMENRIVRKQGRTTNEWRFESLARTPKDSFLTAATLCRCGTLCYFYSVVERYRDADVRTNYANISIYWSILNFYSSDYIYVDRSCRSYCGVLSIKSFTCLRWMAANIKRRLVPYQYDRFNIDIV